MSEGRNYLVTGISGGLGGAVATALFERGAKSVMALNRDELNEEPSELTKRVRFMAQSAGGLDGVFHAAGSEVVAPLRLTKDNAYEYAMFPARSAFAILRACASMGVLRPLASVVLVSSVAAHRGSAGLLAYSAGKAAVEAMARSAVPELTAIAAARVNALALGAFCSPMHARLSRAMPPESAEAYVKKHPLGVGTLNNARDVAMFLLSDESRWVTGTTLVADGGYLAV